jgi:hypothetical protein
MKTRILKFNFPISDRIQIQMPKGAKVLSVQIQHDQPTLWAICNPDAEIETRKFFICGTGHPIDLEGKVYVGTFQMTQGALVWHLFEVL